MTLVGTTHGSRVCHSLLNAIGISDFAAESQEAYVDKVKGLCSNLQTLALLRKNLRQAMCVTNSLLIVSNCFPMFLLMFSHDLSFWSLPSV